MADLEKLPFQFIKNSVADLRTLCDALPKTPGKSALVPLREAASAASGLAVLTASWRASTLKEHKGAHGGNFVL